MKPEEEAWEDDYDRQQKGNVKEVLCVSLQVLASPLTGPLSQLTNSNFHKEIAGPYTVVLATYPWCKSCSSEEFQDVFAKIARNKTLKSKACIHATDAEATTETCCAAGYICESGPQAKSLGRA